VKIAYFGLPLGAQLLLADGHELAPCVLSPLSAPGRRRIRRRIPRTEFFDARGSTAPEFDMQVEQALEQARPDLLVSWFWTRLLPGVWLRSARYGGIGVHPSLLPRHRGPNPYFWTIDAGDERAGVTLHALAPEYDTGAILLQRSVPLAEESSWRLARALDRPSLALLREGVQRFAEGRPPPAQAQREVDASWAPEPTGRELGVDWNWPNTRILRRIRALAPVPGLAIDICGLCFFVTRARVATRFVTALEPGEAAVVDDGQTLVIRTGDGALAIERAVALDEQADEGDSERQPHELGEEGLARAVAARLPNGIERLES
jgi:methionyl-tRNA formyltransferase